MKIVLILFVSVVCLAHSSNVEMRSMTQLREYVDENTLVIFDIDDTVFQATKYDCHTDWGYDQIRREEKNGVVSNTKKLEIYAQWEKAQETCEVEFVEPETLSEIKQLQDRNIKVMALTARGADTAASTFQ